MPLSPTLAQWLQSQGHDAVHASAIGLDRAADTDIITQAINERRIVITADLDYPRLLALAGATGPSLILFRGGAWSEAEVRARMQQLLAGMRESELERSIVVVDRQRLRRRRLPIL
jgi:predicted nuclease of predicted toxin-antitoxin system